MWRAHMVWPNRPVYEAQAGQGGLADPRPPPKAPTMDTFTWEHLAPGSYSDVDVRGLD